MGMWRDSLRRILPIGFFLAEIRSAGPCLGNVHTLHGIDLAPEIDVSHQFRESWLRQVGSYLKDTGMAGLASAWAMARRRPKEYHRKMDAATRCSGVCPHTTLDLT